MDAIAKLVAQHRGCDDLLVQTEAAVRAGDWPQAQAHWAAFTQAMEAHFTLEEAQLFPAFEQATGMTHGPTAVMRGEHAEMRQLFLDLAEALAAAQGQTWLGHGETLLILMQQHNMKEENVLYPLCAQHLADLDAMLTASAA